MCPTRAWRRRCSWRAPSLLPATWPATPAAPDQLLAGLNAELEPDNDACMFVTLVCATVDRSSGSLLVASAGHEAPVLCRGDTCVPVAVESGPALGLQRDADFPLASARLLPGDELLMYSDGITEADNGFHEFFGEPRLFAALAGGCEADGSSHRPVAGRRFRARGPLPSVRRYRLAGAELAR